MSARLAVTPLDLHASCQRLSTSVQRRIDVYKSGCYGLVRANEWNLGRPLTPSDATGPSYATAGAVVHDGIEQRAVAK
jgi:hypothetical protein